MENQNNNQLNGATNNCSGRRRPRKSNPAGPHPRAFSADPVVVRLSHAEQLRDGNGNSYDYADGLLANQIPVSLSAGDAATSNDNEIEIIAEISRNYQAINTSVNEASSSRVRARSTEKTEESTSSSTKTNNTKTSASTSQELKKKLANQKRQDQEPRKMAKATPPTLRRPSRSRSSTPAPQKQGAQLSPKLPMYPSPEESSQSPSPQVLEPRKRVKPGRFQSEDEEYAPFGPSKRKSAKIPETSANKPKAAAAAMTPKRTSTRISRMSRSPLAKKKTNKALTMKKKRSKSKQRQQLKNSKQKKIVKKYTSRRCRVVEAKKKLANKKKKLVRSRSSRRRDESKDVTPPPTTKPSPQKRKTFNSGGVAFLPTQINVKEKTPQNKKKNGQGPSSPSPLVGKTSLRTWSGGAGQPLSGPSTSGQVQPQLTLQLRKRTPSTQQASSSTAVPPRRKSTTEIQCDRCLKSFPTGGRYFDHLKSHDKPKMECELCGKVFTKKALRLKHFRSKSHKDLAKEKKKKEAEAAAKSHEPEPEPTHDDDDNSHQPDNELASFSVETPEIPESTAVAEEVCEVGQEEKNCASQAEVAVVNNQHVENVDACVEIPETATIEHEEDTCAGPVATQAEVAVVNNQHAGTCAEIPELELAMEEGEPETLAISIGAPTMTIITGCVLSTLIINPEAVAIDSETTVDDNDNEQEAEEETTTTGMTTIVGEEEEVNEEEERDEDEGEDENCCFTSSVDTCTEIQISDDEEKEKCPLSSAEISDNEEKHEKHEEEDSCLNSTDNHTEISDSEQHAEEDCSGSSAIPVTEISDDEEVIFLEKVDKGNFYCNSQHSGNASTEDSSNEEDNHEELDENSEDICPEISDNNHNGSTCEDSEEIGNSVLNGDQQCENDLHTEFDCTGESSGSVGTTLSEATDEEGEVNSASLARNDQAEIDSEEEYEELEEDEPPAVDSDLTLTEEKCFSSFNVQAGQAAASATMEMEIEHEPVIENIPVEEFESENRSSSSTEDKNDEKNSNQEDLDSSVDVENVACSEEIVVGEYGEENVPTTPAPSLPPLPLPPTTEIIQYSESEENQEKQKTYQGEIAQNCSFFHSDEEKEKEPKEENGKISSGKETSATTSAEEEEDYSEEVRCEPMPTFTLEAVGNDRDNVNEVEPMAMANNNGEICNGAANYHNHKEQGDGLEEGEITEDEALDSEYKAEDPRANDGGGDERIHNCQGTASYNHEEGDELEEGEITEDEALDPMANDGDERIRNGQGTPSYNHEEGEITEYKAEDDPLANDGDERIRIGQETPSYNHEVGGELEEGEITEDEAVDSEYKAEDPMADDGDGDEKIRNGQGTPSYNHEEGGELEEEEDSGDEARPAGENEICENGQPGNEEPETSLSDSTPVATSPKMPITEATEDFSGLFDAVGETVNVEVMSVQPHTSASSSDPVTATPPEPCRAATAGVSPEHDNEVLVSNNVREESIIEARINEARPENPQVQAAKQVLVIPITKRKRNGWDNPRRPREIDLFRDYRTPATAATKESGESESESENENGRKNKNQKFNVKPPKKPKQRRYAFFPKVPKEKTPVPDKVVDDLADQMETKISCNESETPASTESQKPSSDSGSQFEAESSTQTHPSPSAGVAAPTQPVSRVENSSTFAETQAVAGGGGRARRRNSSMSNRLNSTTTSGSTASSAGPMPQEPCSSRTLRPRINRSINQENNMDVDGFDNRQAQCSICYQWFPAYALESHREVHETLCFECGFLIRRQDFKSHWMSQHLDARTATGEHVSNPDNVCHRCPAGPQQTKFESRDLLGEHAMIIHFYYKETTICEKCGEGFATQATLALHHCQQPGKSRKREEEMVNNEDEDDGDEASDESDSDSDWDSVTPKRKRRRRVSKKKKKMTPRKPGNSRKK